MKKKKDMLTQRFRHILQWKIVVVYVVYAFEFQPISSSFNGKTKNDQHQKMINMAKSENETSIQDQVQVLLLIGL